MRDSDWSRKVLLRSDWSGPSVALSTTNDKAIPLGGSQIDRCMWARARNESIQFDNMAPCCNFLISASFCFICSWNERQWAGLCTKQVVLMFHAFNCCICNFISTFLSIMWQRLVEITITLEKHHQISRGIRMWLWFTYCQFLAGLGIFNLLSFAQMHETISIRVEKESLVTTFFTGEQSRRLF